MDALPPTPLLEKIMQQVAAGYQLREEEFAQCRTIRTLSGVRAVVGLCAADWKSATIREAATLLDEMIRRLVMGFIG